MRNVKTMKLWINDNLELRWNEWPVMPGNPDMIWMDQSSIDQFNSALAKAKAESICFEDNNKVLNILFNHKTDGSFSWTDWCDTVKGTFINFEGEAEAVYQWKNHIGEWIDCGPNEFNGRTVNGYITRQVARLKPVEKVFIDGDFNDSYEARVRRATGKRNKVFENDNVKAYEEGHYWNFQTKDSGAHSFNEGMSDPGVKHYYEETNGNDAADDVGLKKRILKAFNHAWHNDGSRYPDPEVTLQIVLDELKIK